jgi:thioredoxin reductase (NADPH)
VPSTDWLKGCDVKVDRKGFVHTGFACGRAAPGEEADPIALWLETSLPGVFAVGDVRAGSVKRVSAAVGEGAGVVSQLHQRLQALRTQAHAQQQPPLVPEEIPVPGEPAATKAIAEPPGPSAARA